MTTERRPTDQTSAPTARDPGSNSRDPTADPEQHARAVIRLAALLLLISGAFNIIVGLGFLLDDVFAMERTPFAEIATWGGFFLLVGAAKILSGVGLLGRRFWAALIGIVFVSFNLFAHMALLPAYPLQSVLMIVFDTVVLWTLVVHGSQGR